MNRFRQTRQAGAWEKGCFMKNTLWAVGNSFFMSCTKMADNSILNVYFWRGSDAGDRSKISLQDVIG